EREVVRKYYVPQYAQRAADGELPRLEQVREARARDERAARDHRLHAEVADAAADREALVRREDERVAIVDGERQPARRLPHDAGLRVAHGDEVDVDRRLELRVLLGEADVALQQRR